MSLTHPPIPRSEIYPDNWDLDTPARVERLVAKRDDIGLHRWAERQTGELRPVVHMLAFFLAHIDVLEQRCAKLGQYTVRPEPIGRIRGAKTYVGPRLRG